MNWSDLAIPASWARVVLSSTWWCRKCPLRYLPPLVVSIISPSLEELGAYRSQTAPLDYWGASQSGAPTSAPYTGSSRVRSSPRNPVDAFPQEGVDTSHWPMAGPNTRTEVVPTGWFKLTHTRPNGYRNLEAGPSTLVAPSVQYVGPPTPQPSGGISEMTADAETTRTTTEEDGTPVSNFYRFHSRVTAWSFSAGRPNGPGSPAVKDHHASVVCGWGETAAGCVSWCSRGRSLRKFRPSTRL